MSAEKETPRQEPEHPSESDNQEKPTDPNPGTDTNPLKPLATYKGNERAGREKT